MISNHDVAELLRQGADLLEQQQANPFRVNAYRRGAETVAGLEQNIQDLVERQGIDGLLELPNIGKGIASAIYQIVATGHWSQLERWRGTLDPVQLLQTVPGIGPKLARQIYDELQIDNLEALEIAAYDGRLEALPGIGRRRVAVIRAGLANLLGRRRASRQRSAQSQEPAVDLLLEVDREYREQAAAGELATIAPRRFNPEGRAWLPVLHTQRDGWHFTALYSNTPLAHQLGRTHDWVVVYSYDDHQQEDQRTIVTETQGALAGWRVVRGREAECRRYYAAATASA